MVNELKRMAGEEIDVDLVELNGPAVIIEPVAVF